MAAKRVTIFIAPDFRRFCDLFDLAAMLRCYVDHTLFSIVHLVVL